jgi:lysozyme
MKISSSGLDLIKQFEGFEAKAYRCPAGILTIGYGSTGSHVKPGMCITEAEAVALLDKDLDRFENAVSQMAPKSTQWQYDALVSFAYNVGVGALKGSTLLSLHNAGDYSGASAQFVRWNKARVNGVLKPLNGLTRRRMAEADLYRSK